MIPKHFFITALIIVISVKFSTAQESIKLQDKTLVLIKNDFNGTGTPYSTADWVKGTIKQTDGKISYESLLKYNEEADELYFKRSKDGEILKFVEPVTEFTLSLVDSNNKHVEKHYRNGYKKIGFSTALSYYEVLCDGKIQLLRKNKKFRSVNKVTAAYKTDDDIHYYLLVSGKLVAIEKNKKSILSVIGNKKAGFDNFLKTNNLDLENDTNLAELIDAYNSL